MSPKAHLKSSANGTHPTAPLGNGGGKAYSEELVLGDVAAVAAIHVLTYPDKRDVSRFGSDHLV